ncbi:MAG: vitamin K epoxide reductase family protein [Streptosporangiaceae bacterium]
MRDDEARWGLIALVLSVAGLAVSIYLTVAHYAEPQLLACSESGTINCAKVTTSPQSVILGIPVAVLGLPFFVAMTGLNLPVLRRGPGWLPTARIGAATVGILFVLYLVYVELFEVEAICLWCTSVHLLTFVLFGVTLAGAQRRTTV